MDAHGDPPPGSDRCGQTWGDSRDRSGFRRSGKFEIVVRLIFGNFLSLSWGIKLRLFR